MVYYIEFIILLYLMLKVKNLLNSAAFRTGITMVSVKSTRILVFVYNRELNNGWMYPIQYTDKYRHQDYGKRQKTQEIWLHRQKGILLYWLNGVWGVANIPLNFARTSFILLLTSYSSIGTHVQDIFIYNLKMFDLFA